jgi:hypothetical protein
MEAASYTIILAYFCSFRFGLPIDKGKSCFYDLFKDTAKSACSSTFDGLNRNFYNYIVLDRVAGTMRHPRRTQLKSYR